MNGQHINSELSRQGSLEEPQASWAISIRAVLPPEQGAMARLFPLRSLRCPLHRAALILSACFQSPSVRVSALSLTQTVRPPVGRKLELLRCRKKEQRSVPGWCLPPAVFGCGKANKNRGRKKKGSARYGRRCSYLTGNLSGNEEGRKNTMPDLCKNAVIGGDARQF